MQEFFDLAGTGPSQMARSKSGVAHTRAGLDLLCTDGQGDPRVQRQETQGGGPTSAKMQRGGKNSGPLQIGPDDPLFCKRILLFLLPSKFLIGVCVGRIGVAQSGRLIDRLGGHGDPYRTPARCRLSTTVTDRVFVRRFTDFNFAGEQDEYIATRASQAV